MATVVVPPPATSAAANAKGNQTTRVVLALVAAVIVIALLVAFGYWAWRRANPTTAPGEKDKAKDKDKTPPAATDPIAGYKLYDNQNPTCDRTDTCDVIPGIKVATPVACAARCTSDTNCQGFLWRKSGDEATGDCWLKRFQTVPPKTTEWSGAQFYLRR